MAGASLLICLFSTLSAPAVFALRSETFLPPGKITPGGQLWLQYGDPAADKSPFEWSADMFVPHSFLSGARGNPGTIRRGLLGGPKLSPSLEGGVQTSAQQSSRVLRNEFEQLMRAQDEAVKSVSATVTQMMDGVSQAVEENMASVAKIVPLTTAAASSELQKGIRHSGLTMVAALQKMALQVEEAASRASTFVLAVLSGEHPKYRAGEAMRKWGRKARTLGEGVLQTMSRLARSVRRRARRILNRRRQTGATAEEEAYRSPKQLGADASDSDIRELIRHSLQTRTVTSEDLCYRIKTKECEVAVEQLKTRGSFSRIPTSEISFQLPRSKYPSSIKLPTAQACWLLAGVREHVLKGKIPFPKLATLIFEDTFTQGDLSELSRGIFAAATAPSERAERELRILSKIDPLQELAPLYVGYLTVQLAFIHYMRSSPTKTAFIEATCKRGCLDAVWKMATPALRPLGPYEKPATAENSEVARNEILKGLNSLPCRCPKVKEAIATLLSDLLSEMAGQLNSELGETGGVKA